jgi:transcriptional repressor NrdR
VLETRRGDDGAVRRRRECPNCGERFTTHERREREAFDVVKRDGERQPFDRTKLRAALLRAAHKRPVSASDVEALVDRIEREGERAGGELRADRIGELSLAGLRELDLGAYLQFAAVYRQLADPEAIRAELARLGDERNSVRPEDDDAVLPLDTG